MTKLNYWAGSFNEDEHRYYDKNGRELQGITKMLKTMLFKDEYSHVSREVLQAAADRGHTIHSQIELYDNFGVGVEIPEVAAYRVLKEGYHFECLASEYLVSDDENYASAIDKVYHIEGAPDDEIVLGDVKTTYTFNREYVSWQLSVYAYFFELLNPTLRVTELVGVWIRNDKTRGMINKVIHVERKPSEIIRELIRCSLTGEDFTIERIPPYIAENLDRLIWINEAIKALTTEKDELVGYILDKMQSDNADKVDTGVVLFSRKAAGVRITFDTKAFKAEHEDLYEQYARTSEGKESLQVKFRE